MPRRHQCRHVSAVLSQRQLPGGAALRCVSAGLVMLSLASTAAIAEVCDKVAGEQWRPSDGPFRTVVTWDLTWVPPIISLLLLGIPAALVCVPIALKVIHAGERASFVAAVYLKWCAYLATVFMIFTAAFLLQDFIAVDDVMQVAAREGCISVKPNWTLAGATALLAFLYGATVWLMRRGERVAATRFRGLAAQ
jgi:hypothetical protein